MYKVSFFKDRQKFAAAHFTLFTDGDAERLHGHNYQLAVTVWGDDLKLGLLAPFHQIKREIGAVCEAWDERVILPGRCPWVKLTTADGQVDLRLKTPLLEKFYSFPEEDVVILEVDNISCENLTRVLADLLKQRFVALALPIARIEVSVSESAGQTVSYELRL